jgi:hypothetical protein
MNLYSNLFKLLFKFSNVMNDLNFQVLHIVSGVIDMLSVLFMYIKRIFCNISYYYNLVVYRSVLV